MDAWQQKKFKFSKNYSVRLLMYQCVPSSGKSFVITCVFDIMQFDNILQHFFNYCHRGTTLLSTKIIEPSTHRALTCSNSTIKTLEQGVKYVQS